MMNVKTTSLKEARNYTERIFNNKKLNLDREIPNFDSNYMNLQQKMTYSLGIPRHAMPVIEPKDMGMFKRKIKQGHIDIFKPHTKTELFPKEFVTKKSGKEYLTLGLKDGQINDDKLIAKVEEISADNLKPIQDQVWLDNIVLSMMKYGIPNEKKSTIKNAPIITSINMFIIDGHHRWGQLMIANPNLKLTSIVVPLDILTLMQMTFSYGKAIGNNPNY